MSALRKSLERPHTYLAGLVILSLLAVLDTFRAPDNQITGRLYLKGVELYQAVGRPLLREHICCRYFPSCSQYSAEAVCEYGIREGLILTAKRIKSCTSKVPRGTYDPVPQIQQGSANTGERPERTGIWLASQCQDAK